MSECLKILNLCILFILLILNICSIILEIFLITNNNINSKIVFNLLIIDPIISTIYILISIFLGFTSLYSSYKDKLLIYSIIILFFIVIKSLSSVLIYLKESINFQFSFINIIFYIISSQIIILILSFILCLIQRNQLIKEIIESPLNYVDEYMTEDIYRSILKQSLNPENMDLKKDLQKKLELRQADSSRLSSTNSLKSSLKSKE